MLSKPTKYFLCIALFLTFLGCSKDDQLSLIDTNFNDVVTTDQNLNFVFNKPIANDTLLNQWDSTQYVKFEPALKGAFKWYSESVLIFSPATPFPPATKFKVTLTEKLSEKAKVKLGGNKTLSFSTAPLEINTVNAFWSSTSSGSDQTLVHVDVDFSYQINPEEVISKTKISINGQEQKIALVNESANKTLQVYLPDVAVVDETIKLDVTIDAGITPVEGNIATEEKTSETLSLVSPYNIAIEEMTSQHNGVEGAVTVSVSQETAENQKDLIVITPAVKYKVLNTESGIKITSEDFDARKKYNVTIKKGLKGKFGGKLKNDFTKEISFGDLRPEISIESKKSIYLSAKGSKNIKVKIINVDKIQVRIVKLYENNILGVRRSRYYDYEYEEYYYSYRNTGNMGDEIWSKEIDTKDLPKKNGVHVLNLDIEDKLKEYNGIYSLQISSREKYWLNDSKIISLSDIGIVAKEGKNEIMVFTNSIKNTAPLSGVNVSFIGVNNQKMGTATTDENGVAIFSKPKNLPAGFNVSLITAKKQDDYNYLTYNNTSVNTSKFDIGGKYDNLSGLDVFLYGDRDIYRPGETVNLSGIIRDADWNTPSSVPVKIKINTPNGKNLKTIRKTINKFGSFEASVTLSAAAATGNYNVQVFTSNDIFLTSRNIKVEEFIPDRIKVDVSLDKTNFDLTDTTNISLKATNFFGPPAAGRNYEIDITASRRYFYANEYRDYNFYNTTPTNIRFNRKLMKGQTDENGEAVNSYNLGKEYKNIGMVNADIYSTVFDETGRAVNRKNTITISTQDVYYGIKSENYYAATNREVKSQIIAVDKTGKALSGVEARVQLIRHEYKTVLSQSGGYFRYKSQKVEKVMKDQKIVLNGKDNLYTFIPELSGRYEIRIFKPGVRTYVNKTFYIYGWGGTSNSSFQVNSEGQIDIQLDKESYQVGETANVILKSPFSGKILVTLETDKVIKHFYVESDKRAASFPLKIEEGFVPNIYITATLFKPHEESDLPLTIAHGAAPVLVENPNNKLPLTIEVADKSRSKVKQKIKIKSTPNTAVSVAVVDEGILQLTQYATPDPYKFFYRKRALGVRSYDMYPFLFPEISLSSGRTGGDDAMAKELAKRVNPLTNKRVKLVSFWSGIIETDDNGNAEYEIDIPQFSGDLRIMAAAYKGKAFAGAFDNMKVADPVVISTALPRFFSPGDTVMVPVIMSNTTEKAINAKTKLSVSGPVKIVGDKSLNVSIAPNAEGQVIYKIVANKELGQTNISVDVNALGETFKNSTDVTVRPASPLLKISGSGAIKAGNSENVKLADDQFMKQSIERKLVVSTSPMVEFTKDLDYLVRYPHGCLEQTVSAVFPQLYFKDLTSHVLKETDENKLLNSQYFISDAIKKIQLMQLFNGGLTYWPGRGYESWWGSAYAAHFLYEAQKAGYEVDKDMYDRLLSYLETKLKTKETVVYYYNGDQRKTIANRSIPYSLYVLALAGKPQRSTMNYYKSNQHQLSMDSRYMLAATYFLTGDEKGYREILPASFKGEISKRVFGGSFYSYVRDEAIALNMLLEVDNENPQITTMAKHLTTALKTRRYLNTQERVFSFLALGKIARLNADNDVKAVIKIDGKKVADFDNKTMTLLTDKLGSGNLSIETNGTGNLYYFWETEGISVDGSYREEDSFLKVRKSFYTRDGRAITSNKFKQNDLVVVMLSISSSNGEYVENVAMTDILPAGFEIENPRIKEVPGTNWIKNAQRPDHSDIRDDRITFFLNVGPSTHKYYYVVRAVSKGEFQMGPVGADAMYDGEYHSYSGGGTIIVE